MGMTIGIGREIITPKLGGFLFGYNATTVSNNLIDDLDVTALLMKTENTSALLISFAVCLIHDTVVKKISEEAAAIAGIPASNVIVSATHTHSGPPTTRFSGFSSFGNIDWEYIDSIFIPKCLQAVKKAASCMKPAKVGIGTTHSTVGINRRQLNADNSVSLGNNPWDHVDPTMTVISFADENRKSIANVIHVGAHCTAIGNTQDITRDWAGVMVDRVEAETGATSVFINGTLGDVAPRMANSDSIGDMKLMKEVGGVAGVDAMRAFNTIKAYYDEPLEVICGVIDVPFVPPIPKEKAAAMLEASCPEGDRFMRTSLTRLLELYEEGDLGPESLSYDQVLFRIGPVVLVPYPFEVSSEIGLRLRHYSPFAHTLTMSCTNGSHSYLPAESQIARGGYEINSFKWFRPRQMPDNADFLIVEQNLKLIQSLRT